MGALLGLGLRLQKARRGHRVLVRRPSWQAQGWWEGFGLTEGAPRVPALLPAARRTLGLSLALWSQLAGSRRPEDPGPVLGLVVSARRVAPRSLLCEGGAGSPAGVAMALVLVTTLPEAESSVPKCRVPAISGMTFSFFFSSSLFSFFTPMKKSGAGCPLVPLVGRPTFGRSASTQSRLRGSHKLTGLRSCGNSTKAWEQEGPGSPM